MLVGESQKNRNRNSHCEEACGKCQDTEEVEQHARKQYENLQRNSLETITTVIELANDIPSVQLEQDGNTPRHPFGVRSNT